MYCITGWILLYFLYGQFSNEWVQALYAVPYETDKGFGGQILWHSHPRHTPGNLLLFMEIINSMPLKIKRQKSPWRSCFGCLEVQIKKRKRVVFFSWQSLSFDSWNLQAWLWELLHPVFRFVHQRIQNWVEWKHNREGIVSRWTPSAADESSGLIIFKSI